MITTIIYPDPKSWQQHKYHGLAKNKDIVKEMLSFGGWELTNNWGYQVSDHHWADADFFFPCDQKELYVLGGCLLMN